MNIDLNPYPSLGASASMNFYFRNSRILETLYTHVGLELAILILKNEYQTT